MSFPRRLACAIVCLGACWLFSANPCAGEEVGALDELDDSISYRRVFVPADSTQHWPLGEERYLPLAREQFEKLLGQARQMHNHALPPKVRISSSKYYARLETNDVLVGSGELEVELSSDKNQWLPLEPLNLVITSATWGGNEGKNARMGLFRADKDSLSRGVDIPHSGTLFLGWEMRPAKGSDSDRLLYSFQLPAALPQSLQIVLPDDHAATLTTSDGLTSENVADLPGRWLFHLAPGATHQLEVIRGERDPRRQLPRVNQTTAYRIEPQGLKVTSQIRIEGGSRND